MKASELQGKDEASLKKELMEAKPHIDVLNTDKRLNSHHFPEAFRCADRTEMNMNEHCRVCDKLLDGNSCVVNHYSFSNYRQPRTAESVG